MPTRWPRALPWWLQCLLALQWPSREVWFWKFFQGHVWRVASRSFPPPWKFPMMELLKPSVALLPPHFVLKNNSLVARKGGEQLRSQIETCGEEFPSERLPSRSLIGPRGSWFGIRAASPEGISSCSGPGARTATAAQDILLFCAGVVSVPHCRSVNADWL